MRISQPRRITGVVLASAAGIVGAFLIMTSNQTIDAHAEADQSVTVTVQTKVGLSIDRSVPESPVVIGEGDIYMTTADAYSRRVVDVIIPDEFSMETPVGQADSPDGTEVTFKGSLNARNGFENYKAKNGIDGKNIGDLYIGKIRVSIPFTREFQKYGVGTYSITVPVTFEMKSLYGSYSKDLDFTPWDTLIANGDITVAENVLTGVTRDDMILDIAPYVSGITASLKNLTYKEVDFPVSLVTTDNKQPLMNSAVEKVVFAEGTEIIPRRICSGAKMLVDVELPESVRVFDDECFCLCSKLTLDYIRNPHDITLGSASFAYCKSIKELYICKGMKTKIGGGGGPFYDSGIEKVTVADDVGTIPEWICYGCESITEISFPQSEFVIENFAFSRLPDLKEVTIRSDIKRQYAVNDNDIQRCFAYTGIEKLVFEEGVTSIPGKLIDTDSTSLKEIYIPASVKSIGLQAFTAGNIQGGFTVYYGGTRSQWNALNAIPGCSMPKVMAAKVVCSDSAASKGSVWDSEENDNEVVSNYQLQTEDVISTEDPEIDEKIISSSENAEKPENPADDQEASISDNKSVQDSDAVTEMEGDVEVVQKEPVSEKQAVKGGDRQ